MYMKYFIAAFFVVFSSLAIQAQDYHFTQFYAAPLTLNPALTGAFDGKYRVSTIYRDQWRSPQTSPYQTFAASTDFRFELDNHSKSQDVVAVGLLVANDRSKIYDSNQTQIMISGAYIKSLNDENNQFLTLGLQGGLAQRGVNYENFNLPDEWNGSGGYTYGTLDQLPTNTTSYGDLSTGVNYTFAPSRKTLFFVGAAIHHITQPNISFYDADKQKSFLKRKYSVQMSAQLPINERVTISPRVLFAIQGTQAQLNVGTNFRVKLGENTGTALHLGGWIRPTKNVDKPFEVTDGVLMCGLELNNFLLGMSYDLNLKSIPQYNRAQGAFEISLGYLGNFDSETILCPKF